MTPKTLVITVGDPRGIGPEIVESAVLISRATDWGDNLDLVVLGTDEHASLFNGPRFESVGSCDGSERSAGRVSVQQIERATQLCLAGDAVGIVTGPVSKPALWAAGRRVPGQTELLEGLAAQPGDTAMLMCAETTSLGGPLRVVLATRHVPLKRVPAAVTTELLIDQTRILFLELRSRWGIASPRIALCALNPHASDNGLFGDEEARVFEPAVERLRGEGLEVTGPVPADTVFVRSVRGEFDAVVAPYHDVGMAAFKTASFGAGVNVTLGLPFIRTSPDHGTAFDIAGTGRADPSSMLEAMRLAAQIAGTRGS
ncbi:MAG: 4-hydroxythreonine-4-phosphate dehydrogenase PdxA [Myxococcales bacterium]|nr:4-hydroxythreonine-4-phosphate dehydrogenase PdxA [Myxococcales bacterium]